MLDVKLSFSKKSILVAQPQPKTIALNLSLKLKNFPFSHIQSNVLIAP
jgi:hypothetical protein